jgi:propionyl-CoA carboxylase alpha chain
MPIITKLLIANRGEIARRIMRTAKAMGIRTVAVYADPDAKSPYVFEADQAVALKGISAAETYLDMKKIISAARQVQADAVHPGYGFLAESATFARAVIEAGLCWVGPPPEAIAAMGDKLEAKKRMEAAGVPMLPAGEVNDGDPQNLEIAARSLGFPLLIKAAAGGGGKGMRIVRGIDELSEAFEAARREAAAAFGNSQVFFERYLEAPRHVEVQILGDQQGNLIHCFERECSIQRRHQKIIEEAPSPAVDERLRDRLTQAALAAARAIGYTNAGTVEFLLDRDGTFYFLEMNTRLQVEHPVTEAITGLDLVREQLRIAMGGTLEVGQADLVRRGHAIEARLYAEDPANDFLPTTGRITAWEIPAEPPARFDSGIETGTEVSVHFDPILAKVIVYAPSRMEACLRLALVLEKTRIQGVITNRDFLAATLRHEAFIAGDTTTDFIERVNPVRQRTVIAEEIRQAAVAVSLASQAARRAGARVLATIPSGFRNSPMPMEEIRYQHEEKEITVYYRMRRDGIFDIRADDLAGEARLFHWGGGVIDIEVDGERSRFFLSRTKDLWWIHGPAGEVRLIELPRFPQEAGEVLLGGLAAPMPGKVILVHVAPGERVQAGQVLLVMEAMKMEHPIRAVKEGVVSEVRVRLGDQVEAGQVLIVVEPIASEKAEPKHS